MCERYLQFSNYLEPSIQTICLSLWDKLNFFDEQQYCYENMNIVWITWNSRKCDGKLEHFFVPQCAPDIFFYVIVTTNKWYFLQCTKNDWLDAESI